MQWPLQELAGLKGLTGVIPILMSAFAFAYVVGYFLAFDLAWFPFFSLSEHIVFRHSSATDRACHASCATRCS
jgi:hypothetical protein